jgi:Mg-chelatase subunit ChlD
MSKDIIVVLDESGSMKCMGNEPAEAVNTFIKEQKEACDGKVSMYTFNSNVTTHYTDTPIKDVQEFKKYSPDGFTSLYDAIGTAINNKKENVKGVCMVIVTDGQDNTSKEFNKKSILELINKMKKENDWQIVYLASDEASFSEGEKMGISCNAMYNQNSSGGLLKSLGVVSRGVSAYRSCQANKVDVPTMVFTQK